MSTIARNPINSKYTNKCRATIIVSYRPYILRGPAGSFLSEEKYWQTKARQQARLAAANTNAVLEKLIEADMVNYLKPMT